MGFTRIRNKGRIYHTAPHQELEARFKRFSRIDHALTLLQWDQRVMMPPGATTPGPN